MKSKIFIVVSIIFVVAVGVLGYGFFVFKDVLFVKDKFMDGTTINGIDVSGLNQEQATNVVQTHLDSKRNDIKITLNYQDKTWTLSGKDFEIDNHIVPYVENVFDYFNSGNLFQKKTKLDKLNGNKTYLDKPINLGDAISCNIDFNETSENIVPAEMDLDIIYEDDGLLVINKKPGVAVHPSILHYTNSLSNGVKYYFDSIGLKRKIRPVNRLDRDTSGLVIFAKNEYIQECLIKQMMAEKFYKEYIAILEGILDKKSGTIDAPIARKDNSIIERCVNPNGAKAITNFQVIDEFNNLSLVKFVLKTGRTHQIRVHSQYIGHPILGDTLYGNPSKLINRQALHCKKMSFINPVTKKQMEFISPVSEDIKVLFVPFF